MANFRFNLVLNEQQIVHMINALTVALEMEYNRDEEDIDDDYSHELEKLIRRLKKSVE